MKKIIIIVALLIIKLISYVQIDPVRTELNNIFQNINKTQIPTGYLIEYGPKYSPLNWFNNKFENST